MKKHLIKNGILFSLIILFTNSCVEEFDIKTLSFNNVLVIEATITNEFKHQKISLSKTFKLEEDGPLPESNASVKITDDLNNTYLFSESDAGEYISNIAFEAESNRNYQLQITTSDGKSYSSKPTQLTSSTQIDKVYAKKEVDNFGSENVTIFLDSFDPTGNSKYYRYEYEETFKIIAPLWSAYDLIAVPGSRFAVEKVFKTKEERVCYKTTKSNAIIQVETNGFSEDRISKFPVRVLSKDNTIISHRYSILIKQYVESFEAYTYYKTLNKLSGSESVFSQNQPGFLNGNIFSVDNPDEKVVGFFEVASVSISQRLFFDFQDFFSYGDIPPYFTDCDGMATPSIGALPGESSLLVELLNSGTVKYFGPNPNYPNPLDETEGPYLLVKAQCGDCTRIGSNVKPDFWIE